MYVIPRVDEAVFYIARQVPQIICGSRRRMTASLRRLPGINGQKNKSIGPAFCPVQSSCVESSVAGLKCVTFRNFQKTRPNGASCGTMGQCRSGKFSPCRVSCRINSFLEGSQRWFIAVDRSGQLLSLQILKLRVSCSFALLKTVTWPQHVSTIQMNLISADYLMH